MGDMLFIPGEGVVTGMLMGEVMPGGRPWGAPGEVTGYDWGLGCPECMEWGLG